MPICLLPGLVSARCVSRVNATCVHPFSCAYVVGVLVFLTRSRKAILPGAFGLAAVLSLVAYLRRSEQQCEKAPLHLFIIVSCATLAVFSVQLSALYMLHRTRQKPVLALLVLTSAFAFAWAVTGAVWTGMR